MSLHAIVSTANGDVEVSVNGVDAPFKKVMGKVNTSTNREWNTEWMTSSFRTSAIRVISGSVPGVVPATVGAATAYGMAIQTGSTLVADNPNGGRIYLAKDAADTTGTTWVTVLTSSLNFLSSQGRHFSSTGSDKNFVLNDWVAPWHATSSADTSGSPPYQVKVYAVWKTPGSTGGSVASGPDTITEISASNMLGWVFNYDAGVLKFTNPTKTFYFTNFVTFEENLASLTDYTDNGWHILSQTRTTTEHTVTLGGGWASGSLASPTWRPLSDIVTANTGSYTGSCIAVDGYRFTGRSIWLG